MAYTCKNCGAVAHEPGHLCKDKLAAMKFVCGGCGRVAMEQEHLCKPSPIA
jgi:hypothetical protein